MRYSQTSCHIQISYFIPSHIPEKDLNQGVLKYELSGYKPLWLEKEVQPLPKSGHALPGWESQATDLTLANEFSLLRKAN